jgi:hypothetical protein
MSGTEQKPCKECKWNKFETWLANKGEDVCLKCSAASRWEKEVKE